MVTSLYGSFFRVTGRLWSKPTVHRWHIIQPDDLAEIGISSGCYDNVIMSSGWHTLPFLSHPDEIANFDFPHHAVALQRLRTIDVGNQIYPSLHICQLALRQTLATERIRYQAFNSNQQLFNSSKTSTHVLHNDDVDLNTRSSINVWDHILMYLYKTVVVNNHWCK